ncbi:glycoside hydrolase family protein [Rhizobium ruizarguesonis]
MPYTPKSRWSVIVLCFAMLAPTGSHAASNLAVAIKFLMPSIVKISVSFQKSILVDNVEQCQSEGTGFIIDSTHILTDEHVYSFNPSCGKAEIFAKSNYASGEWHLNVVDSRDDIALLETDDNENINLDSLDGRLVHPCSAAVSPVNVYDVVGQGEAFRYGIPGGLSEPTSVGVEIGSESNEFQPLVKITPIPLNPGESGGPIVTGALVVGIMRSKSVHTPMIGLMTPASEISLLLDRNKVFHHEDEECRIILMANSLLDRKTNESLVENFEKVSPTKPVGQLRSISPAGLDIMKKFDGWSNVAYDDASGYCTIGYGHLISLKRCSDTDLGDFKGSLSQEQGAALLEVDARSAVETVQQLVKVALSDEQFSALVSFVFNVGGKNFQSSSMLVALNQRNFGLASKEFERWVKANGRILMQLAQRRACERALFESDPKRGQAKLPASCTVGN